MSSEQKIVFFKSLYECSTICRIALNATLPQWIINYDKLIQDSNIKLLASPEYRGLDFTAWNHDPNMLKYIN
jgi:hypothetical protein